MAPPPIPQPVTIAGPAGPIEALAEIPEGHDGRRCAIVCHPHPLFGGTMQNKVVHMAARALQELGYATLRFNFRGVGASAGTFDDGSGETDDALAVYDYATTRWPGATPVIAGFSFGSYVAFRVALQREVAALVMIAPPVRRFDFAATELPSAPWLIIQGDADDVVECADVTHWVDSLSPRPRYEVLVGAGHFFHGRLTDVKALIQTWMG